MANPVYLTLNGELQGLISSGCSSMPSIGNKAQIAHQDQIMVMSLSHGLSRAQNVNHQELTITKPVDKSSLLGKAISENECLTCDFVFYRTNRFGINEPYYKLKLTNARISNIGLTVPHTINDSQGSRKSLCHLPMRASTGSTSSPEPVRTVCGVNGFSKLHRSLSSALLLYFKKAI